MLAWNNLDSRHLRDAYTFTIRPAAPVTNGASSDSGKSKNSNIPKASTDGSTSQYEQDGQVDSTPAATESSEGI